MLLCVVVLCFILYVGGVILLLRFGGFVVVCCFFFQAEDGIRDLVRSRGLGDVYKRQELLELAAQLELASLHETPPADWWLDHPPYPDPFPLSLIHI